jgi:sec-independent protein translocase protein TatA
MAVFAFIPGLDFGTSVLLLVVGILIFGKRLPEVGKQVAKIYFDFRRSMEGVKNDLLVHGELNLDHLPQRQAPPVSAPPPPRRITATAPKFTEDLPEQSPQAPPPAAPQAPAEPVATAQDAPSNVG